MGALVAQNPAAPAPGASPGTSADRVFQFEVDTFAYANDLIWRYQFDPGTGRMTASKTEPAPAYAHRCFVMVRAARQFFFHARFDPTRPVADAPTYRRLIRAVMRSNPRRRQPDDPPIVIPGHDSLRAFSRSHEALLKATCGGAWQSYVLRSHWRMVFPISRGHQERTARQLMDSLRERRIPILHLVRFPQLTINHGVVLIGHAATETGATFQAYDPNQPAAPTVLHYDRATRTFLFPRNGYWGGGRVDAIEIYRGLWY